MSESASSPEMLPEMRSVLRRQVRGSTMLLVGRGCSILLNLATQIAIIRALQKHDYGAFAYAVSIVETASLAAAFCMDKTLSRYGAIYHERQRFDLLAGSVVLSVSIPLALGAILAGATFAFRSDVAGWLGLDATASAMLLVVIWLVPLNAFSSVVMSLSTVLRGPRALLVRKHVCGPALKLGLVLGLVLLGGAPIRMAWALMFAGLCGFVADVWLLTRLVRAERLWTHIRWPFSAVPAREFLAFGIPLLASDLSYLARGALVVVLLGWLGRAEGTASYRAVFPIVRLNELVIVNFALLFTPLASRLFARGATSQLGEVYRRTSLWIMTLSFPLFAGCAVLARPLIELLLGLSYLDAVVPLVVLSVGYYMQAAFGFLGRLMKVLGLVRQQVVIDLAGTAAALGAAWLLIPPLGSLGAAVAVCAGIAVQIGLRVLALNRTDVACVDQRATFRPYATAMLSAALLAIVGISVQPDWLGGISLAVVTSAAVLLACLPHLDLPSIFPELSRLPMSRWLARFIV